MLLAFLLQITKKTSLTNIYGLSGLRESTSYNIQVTTLTTKGDSPISDILRVRTKKLKKTSVDELKDSLGINTIDRQLDNAIYGISSLNSGFSNFKSGFRNLKSGVGDLKSGFSNLKSGVKNLKSEVSNLKSGGRNLKSEVSNLKSGVSSLKKVDEEHIYHRGQLRNRVVSTKIRFENNIS